MHPTRIPVIGPSKGRTPPLRGLPPRSWLARSARASPEAVTYWQLPRVTEARKRSTQLRRLQGNNGIGLGEANRFAGQFRVPARRTEMTILLREVETVEQTTGWPVGLRVDRRPAF